MQLSPPKLEKERGKKLDKRISDETGLGLPKKDVGTKKIAVLYFLARYAFVWYCISLFLVLHFCARCIYCAGDGGGIVSIFIWIYTHV